MSRAKLLPRDIEVKRSDPIYMAHAYLTKVPVPAIIPFIETFTEPGGIVADVFAGSGMTGVAAVACGRNAKLSDVSVLGQHIGRGYLNLVDSGLLRSTATKVVEQTYARLGGIYGVRCSACTREALLAKSVWSMVFRCSNCKGAVNFYASLEAADWYKSKMQCPHCQASFGSRSERIGETPCVDFIDCTCSRSQIEQPSSTPLGEPSLAGLEVPDLPIDASRQMYVASALGRNGFTSTASFFSMRNLQALTVLRDEIQQVDDTNLSAKLFFAFTAILSRASKRYQWSKARPLNAANANYYVAPVFYEWNVLDLFDRKVDAIIKANDWLLDQQGDGSLFGATVTSAEYVRASAVSLPYPDHSIDYVFTDPPFGSNIFYADMNLFHEAWIGATTALEDEAVVDRSKTSADFRGPERYERMLTDALRECRRVLKPGGYLSMVFGNSSGAVWSLIQRAVAAADFVIEPEMIATLDKGQRSVKGLASGFEHVATIDLILTMRVSDNTPRELVRPDHDEVRAVTRVLALSESLDTPSHLYVALLRAGLQRDWDLGSLDLRDVTAVLCDLGYSVDEKSGRLTRTEDRRSS